MSEETKKRRNFVVCRIVAWYDEKEGWFWGNFYCLGKFSILDGEDEKQAFLEILNRFEFAMPRKCDVVWGNDMYEVRDHRTKQPLFAAIPLDF